jgi:DNA modification methylase
MEENKIYYIDCLEGMKQMKSDSIDLIITDPPYNLNKCFVNDNLKEEEFINFLTPIMNEMARLVKPKHSVIIFFDSGQKLPLFWKSLFKSNLYFQKACNLYKPNDCSMPHNRTLRTSEVFYICSKTPQLNHEGEKYIHDCLIANHIKKEGWYHPTAKNVNIFRELIKSHSKIGWLVLDPFMGSGTTALICNHLGRRYIGFELEKKFEHIPKIRLSQKTLDLNLYE